MKRNSSSSSSTAMENRIGANGSSSSSNGPGPAMQITSDEVNFLIFRYLQEAGFVHSAFTFINESMISRSNIGRSDIPPGALISFLQKGLQYVGIEETIRQDGSDRLRDKGKAPKPTGTASASSATSATSATSVHNDDNNNGNGDSSNEIIDFSLLSPNAVKALIRRDTPIQLNVPPEAAAAAIRAKIEAESKAMEMKRQTQSQTQVQTMHSSHSRPSQTNGPIIATHQNALQPTPSSLATTTTTTTRQQAIQNSKSTTPTSDKTRSSSSSQWATTAKQDNNNIATQHAAEAMAMMNQQQIPPNIRLTSNGFETSTTTTTTTGGQLNAAANAKAAAAHALASVAQRAVQHNNDISMVGNNSMMSHNNNINSNSHNSRFMSTISAQAVDNGNTMQLNHDNTRNKQQQLQNDVEKEDLLTRARPDEVMILNKHSSEVFMCAWNPIFTNLLATGSGDASARIWEMGSKNSQSRLLPHGNNSSDKKNKDVTTLEWSSDGELLATGSYDGVARVWRKDGSIVHTLSGHMGPIFSLKWNKRGNYLLSGSYDKTTIVWDVWEKKGVVKQQFHNHEAPALDVDWKDDETFASCSTDKSVLICKVGETDPLFKLIGHKDEVNAVKWDPSGTLLASCSDDHTAKVWNISSGSNQPMYDFKSHKQEIYTVKWSPTGPGSKNPNKPLMLATASFDGSVRLWDVKDGSCISILSRHRDSVYSVSFSPSGEYLASGSLAGQLYIWRVRDGQHVKNFKGKGDIFEVAWNVEETRVAACFSSNVVNVIDFSPL